MAKINSYEWTTQELLKKREQLRAGDKLLLSGTIYTARDAAHKRLKALLEQGQALPFELQGAIIYYAGPTGTPEHMAIGSCGPTTASRMDPYAPQLLDLGLLGMIGKGERSQEREGCDSAQPGRLFMRFGRCGGAGCQVHYPLRRGGV